MNKWHVFVYIGMLLVSGKNMVEFVEILYANRKVLIIIKVCQISLESILIRGVSYIYELFSHYLEWFKCSSIDALSKLSKNFSKYTWILMKVGVNGSWRLFYLVAKFHGNPARSSL